MRVIISQARQYGNAGDDLLYSWRMRITPLLMLVLIETLSASEPPTNPAFPLWDGSESVADYAKRANLPPTKTLDLGNGVKLELVLIPAGKFVMGASEPVQLEEDGFRKNIITGQTVLAASSIGLLVILVFIIGQAVRERRRPKYSLVLLLMMTVMGGGCVLSGLHWRQSARNLKIAQLTYMEAKSRYEKAWSHEKNTHQVTLTTPYYFGKYPVTQEEYEQMGGVNTSTFKDTDIPIGRISWNAAQDFCSKVSQQTGQILRLPTEAEWEFACRAGSRTDFHSGDSEDDLRRIAWYSGNSSNRMHPVGHKSPNAFNLYDMEGNVYQWCQDRLANYTSDPEVDPQGPNSCPIRVLRGGAWCSNPEDCRCAYRHGGGEADLNGTYGFRIVLALRQRFSP